MTRAAHAGTAGASTDDAGYASSDDGGGDFGAHTAAHAPCGHCGIAARRISALLSRLIRCTLHSQAADTRSAVCTHGAGLLLQVTEAPATTRAVRGTHGARCRLRTRTRTAACCQHRARSPIRASATPAPRSRCAALMSSSLGHQVCSAGRALPFLNHPKHNAIVWQKFAAECISQISKVKRDCRCDVRWTCGG